MTPDGVVFDGRRWSNAAEDRVEIQPYDPRWPSLYAEEVARIQRSLGFDPAVRFEHVGSTAVPGLAAKPIIDIALIPPSDSDWERFVAPLESLGYVFWAENPRTDRMFFVKGMPPLGRFRTHHVHVRTAKDAALLLLFRDHLRAHPETATGYEQLKQRLAQEFPTDRDAYTNGKGRFVRGVLEHAAPAMD